MRWFTCIHSLPVKGSSELDKIWSEIAQRSLARGVTMSFLFLVPTSSTPTRSTGKLITLLNVWSSDHHFHLNPHLFRIYSETLILEVIPPRIPREKSSACIEALSWADSSQAILWPNKCFATLKTVHVFPCSSPITKTSSKTEQHQDYSGVM